MDDVEVEGTAGGDCGEAGAAARLPAERVAVFFPVTKTIRFVIPDRAI